MSRGSQIVIFQLLYTHFCNGSITWHGFFLSNVIVSKCAHAWMILKFLWLKDSRKKRLPRWWAIVYFSDCHRNSMFWFLYRTPQLLGAYETKDLILFFSTKKPDFFLFILLVPLSTFHLAREDYCFYPDMWNPTCNLHYSNTTFKVG